jgi:hypothetical protein
VKLGHGQSAALTVSDLWVDEERGSTLSKKRIPEVLLMEIRIQESITEDRSAPR